MITEATLKRLLANTQEIIKLAEKFNLTNLRLCLPQDEDYNTLHILTEFSSEKPEFVEVSNTFTLKEKTLEEKISELLDCPVKVWEQGGSKFTEYGIEEANENPITDSTKIIEFFHDVLIPTSQENASKFESTKEQFSPDKLSFFASQQKQIVVTPDTLEQFAKILDILSQNPQAWAEATELFSQKKQSIGTLPSSQVSRSEDKFPLSYNLQGPNPTSAFSSLHSLKFNLNGRRLEIYLENKVDNFKLQGILRDQALKQNLCYFENPNGISGILLSQDDLFVKSEIEKFVSNLKQLGYTVDLEEEKKLDVVGYQEELSVNRP